ncbi:phosphoinositide 3-kinase adapter protein 1-like isoform X2 [Macrosteles quadrilineatus]|uniref:phosphoinositide 3-kinase adapter protein 1-like isoform X2 n=1 Tax=Macrosteles quadrilineatus TaxID=74068 RepID=UPI0023E1E1CF|nr:phosphoinositide 3-kinase adapter protein 1-like isoform X2 [Macrosteles quadrilineatus]
MECLHDGSKGGDLLDIVILSSSASEAAGLWVSYLSTCFQQVAKERNRPPFKVLCLSVEDVLTGVTVASQHDSVFKARLQLVILCPVLLQCLSAAKSPGLLGTLLQPGHVLGMLLGVTDESITLQHRAALLCYNQWQRQVVKDQDPMFVGDFLGTAMDILSRSFQLQQAISQIHKDENKAHFSVLPKKIKVGQNKLLVLLVDPLEPNDNVQITIDKNGQKIEITSFKKRNPYTLQFAVPATCLQVSMLVTVAVEKNGKSIGHRLVKCESRMRELDQLLRSSDNPLQFICQTLGLSPGDREQLDVFLAAAFQQNLPPHFNLLRSAGLRYHSSCEEFPTLLHFAAKFGLEKLTWQLLECPGGEQASQIRNSCQLTAADLAERAGHARLANTLKGFLQMTELSNMYSYLKGVSEKQANDLVMNFNCTNYLLPRPLNNTYSVPPAARPVLHSPPPSTHPMQHQYTNVDSYQIPPSPVSVDNFDYNVPSFPIPVHSPMDNYQVPGHAIPYNPPTPPTPSSPLDVLPPGGYMDMQSPNNSTVGSANQLRRKMTLNLPHHEYYNCSGTHETPSTAAYFHSPDDTISCESNVNRHRNSSHSSNSGKSSSTSAQDELAEIINDFKNNVFTIAEVEKLVENWQNRHDVQQSFKEKQKQLNEMREEYERIQQQMKDNMKRATPFERIRKFFTRGKNKNCTGECKTKPQSASSCSSSAAVSHRPASSLSLQSSCSSTSSGRMSTGSGSSLGDSGTHSDSDDRKTSEGSKNDLRSKMLAGRLYMEIPQRDFTKEHEVDEKHKLLESSGSGPKPCFLHRSNSLIQETTIVEEVDENPKSLEETLSTSLVDKEITMVDVHSIPCDTCGNQTEPMYAQVKKLPLPPGSVKKEETAEIATSNENVVRNEEKLPERLIIIESDEDAKKASESSEQSQDTLCNSSQTQQMDSVQTLSNSVDSPDSSENNHLNGSEIKEDSLDDKLTFEEENENGFVKNMVNFIENEHNFNVLDDEIDDTCEHLLDEADTEVVFELPDYVNVTSPPIPPRPACGNVST